MADINKFGLARNIPVDVKQAVRSRCGFGCVVCGSGIIDYEHFQPEFKNAKEHVEHGITLLCPTCHRKKLKGHLSLAQIINANQNPKARSTGFISEFFYLGHSIPKIKFAGNTFIQCQHVITVYGESYLSISRNSKDPSGPILINAKFNNSSGQTVLDIIDNEWHAYSQSWDVDFVGPLLKIRSDKKSTALAIRFDVPDTITIEKINMTVKDVQIVGDSANLQIRKENQVLGATLMNNTFSGCFSVIAIFPDSIVLGSSV